MFSLLEVTSSVAVMTGERDILAVLDAKVYGGVVQVREKSIKKVVLAVQNYLLAQR